MRLWSLHPCYLDAKGLVALWREGLLARKVLPGQTTGYRNHPQLERFRAQADPIAAIDQYLLAVYEEACHRGYRFDRSKIQPPPAWGKLLVTDGQLRYEFCLLKQKLKRRDPAHYEAIAEIDLPRPHPLFVVVSGDIASWERAKPLDLTGC
nr:DNA lyase [Chloroflexota bacterium]